MDETGEEMNEIKWTKLFERKGELLIAYHTWPGRKFYPEVLGIDARPQHLNCKDGWLYLDLDELIQEQLAIKKAYETDPAVLGEIVKKAVIKGQELANLAKKSCQNLKAKTNTELAAIFTRFDATFQKFSPFIWIGFSVEGFLTERITKALEGVYPKLSKAECRDILTALSTPQKPTTAIEEYKELLRLASDCKKQRRLTAQLEEQIKRIFERYYWLGAVQVAWSYTKLPYALEHYTNVIKELAAGDPEQELRTIEQKEEEIKRKFEELSQRKEITPEVIQDAQLLQEYVWLRTARGEYITQALVYARPLLADIATRVGVKFEDITWFSPEEIAAALKTGKIPDFESRKAGYDMLIIEDKISLTAVAEKAVEKFEEVRLLKGSVAQPGFVTGKVKIILSAKDIDKVEKGDILVTKMTSPDMMLGIRKVAAIVCDEGGITSHASIISREFKIPCIIGTENATKVLKDGDLVKVDADKGIAEIVRSDNKKI